MISPLLTVASPKGPAERGNQSQPQLDGHRTPWITQCFPVAHGPPRLEQYAPAIPVRILPSTGPFPRVGIQPFLLRIQLQEVPNEGPTAHVPLPHTGNVAGPSRGNPSLVHSGVPVAEDLKNLASRYLHNPSTHVDKLRMRRSRSGTVKVLILLEIDDTM